MSDSRPPRKSDDPPRPDAPTQTAPVPPVAPLPPGPHAVPGGAPMLQRPATGPAPISARPGNRTLTPIAPMPGQPIPTPGQPMAPPPGLLAHGPKPMAPTGVTPPMGVPPMGYPPQPIANPFQSQIVPPSYPRGPSAPGSPAAPIPPGGAHATGPQPVPAPGSAPSLPGVPAPAPGSMPSPTGALPAAAPFPAVGLPRITVQYPQVGTQLTSKHGTYVVRDVIGAGEFGAVYECIGPFDQIYALKMVRPSNRPYSEVQAEWAREQSRLFSLRHPNVVYIYDSFEQGHLFYLALERCDHALKAMLGTPMQEGLVLEMSRQLLAAVQFLHDNDVVHDDIHAGNVLITHTDRPTVKISDFGISNELRGQNKMRPNVVHHAIMAPEILATGYTSRQSDLYQVGLLLYWMLVGEPAIQMEVPYKELVRQVSEGEPRQRAEALGTDFGRLIAKMLRRREAFRYTTAREVWSDLRELTAWKNRHLFPVK